MKCYEKHSTSFFPRGKNLATNEIHIFLQGEINGRKFDYFVARKEIPRDTKVQGRDQMEKKRLIRPNRCIKGHVLVFSKQVLFPSAQSCEERAIVPEQIRMRKMGAMETWR